MISTSSSIQAIINKVRIDRPNPSTVKCELEVNVKIPWLHYQGVNIVVTQDMMPTHFWERIEVVLDEYLQSQGVSAMLRGGSL